MTWDWVVPEVLQRETSFFFLPVGEAAEALALAHLPLHDMKMDRNAGPGPCRDLTVQHAPPVDYWHSRPALRVRQDSYR